MSTEIGTKKNGNLIFRRKAEYSLLALKTNQSLEELQIESVKN